MGADDSSDSEGGGDLAAHYRSSMGAMGGGSSGSEDCSDGSGDLGPAWGGADGEFGAGAEMEGSLSDSAASGSDVPPGGLRCGDVEPVPVVSSDEAPSADEQVAVKEELVEESEPAVVVPPPARRPRLRVS